MAYPVVHGGWTQGTRARWLGHDIPVVPNVHRFHGKLRRGHTDDRPFHDIAPHLFHERDGAPDADFAVAGDDSGRKMQVPRWRV
jgi:hypothetical protein